MAGDDVDLCWRMHERGWTIGFSPAAMVWHHRRNSVRAYWKQQTRLWQGRGLLEQKWPEKYNSPGHRQLGWAHLRQGHTAGGAGAVRDLSRHLGSAPFQSLYEPPAGCCRRLPLMPEWYLLLASARGVFGARWPWPPLS